MNKIKQLKTHFKTLSHGCNLIVGECLRWSPSCINTMAVLVAGINKAFKDSNKEQEHLEEKENKRQVADALMGSYKKMQSSSIYKVME
mmetsp:Transcript_17012/g.2810  ORF Transcript_17012/g.2810 Transcript_17012/m.2810 type:complete len:88 (+) Transcript_17012:1267-1530(+)